MTERVDQADPAACVRIAREALREASSHLIEGGDWEKALEAVNTARAWLPFWLERSWDDRMAEWLNAHNAPKHEARPPHPLTQIGKGQG